MIRTQNLAELELLNQIKNHLTQKFKLLSCGSTMYIKFFNIDDKEHNLFSILKFDT